MPVSRAKDPQPPDAGGAAPRAASTRVKKELLRGAVRANVDSMAGRRPSRRPREVVVRSVSAVPRVVLLLLVAALLLAANELVPTALGVREAVLPDQVAQLSVRATPVHPDGPIDVALGEPRPLDPTVFPVGLKRIVLDPGHGGRDRGTTTPRGLHEKDLALDIAIRVRDLVSRRSDLDVLMTREDDRYILLKDRAYFANAVDADLFVSIHLNWIDSRRVRGVETYFLGPTDDPYLSELASAENRESGYSLADVRRLLDGIYMDLRQRQSRLAASSVQATLFDSLRLGNETLQDRGVKSAPFLVLVESRMPAVLAEVSCLSNETEAALLETEEYRDRIAEALAEGVLRYAAHLEEAATKGASTG